MSKTCEYETDIDVDPFPERCGKPATAQATDGATDEVHHVCDEHATAVEGVYEIARLCVSQTTKTWNYGAWREVTTCATHTYFGNGVEPNDWPCLPETRVPAQASDESEFEEECVCSGRDGTSHEAGEKSCVHAE